MLDMGGRHGWSQKEMEALFKEIELARLLTKLLRSRRREEVEEGLALLRLMEPWLPLKMKVEYAKLMAERVLDGLSPSVVERALEFVWSYQRYLGRSIQTALLRPGTAGFFRAANDNAHVRGRSRYAGTDEARAA